MLQRRPPASRRCRPAAGCRSGGDSQGLTECSHAARAAASREDMKHGALLSHSLFPTTGSTAHLGHRLLAAAAAHAHAVHHIALLGLVAQAARLVRAAGARQADQAGQLAVLPRAHAQQEAQHITARQQRDAWA